MTNEILNIEIQNINNTLLVSSQTIANNLNKEHKDVCKKIIEVLEISENFRVSNFEALKQDYKDSMNRTQTEYLLTKDGFVLLLMNYTGYNEFKRAYIKRFNEMEQQLKQISYSQPQLINPQPQPTSIYYKNIINPKIETVQEYIINDPFLSKYSFRYKFVDRRLLINLEDTLAMVDITKGNKVLIKNYYNSYEGLDIICNIMSEKTAKQCVELLKYLRIFRKEIMYCLNAVETINLNLLTNDNKILIEYLNEQKTLEIQELKNQLIKKDETIKLIADETSSRNTKLKIKANIVLNVNTFVFKSGYSHLDVYVYAYKQLFLMHPNVNWREEFFTSNNKLDYLMNKNISYLKELESLVLDLNLSQEQNQTVSR